MKSFLPIVIVALLATLLHSTEYVGARELCPQDNCLSPEKCDDLIVGGSCQERGTTCCSIVKEEFRTHCQHFGGECMDKCGTRLQRNAVDCPEDTVCCVLV